MPALHMGGPAGRRTCKTPVVALCFLASTTDFLGDALEDLATLALSAPELFLDRLDCADQEADGLAKDYCDRCRVAGEEPDGGGGDMREDARGMVGGRDTLDGATGYHEQAEEPQEHSPSGAAQDAQNMKSCTCYRHKSTPLPANATPAPFLPRKRQDQRIRTPNPQP